MEVLMSLAYRSYALCEKELWAWSVDGVIKADVNLEV